MPDQAAVIASELASNLDKHAHDGTVHLQPLPLGTGLEIVATDRGPGMADLQQCLSDGYTTTGTLGSGLGAIRRMATDFTVHTEVDRGTLVCARLALPGTVPAPVATVCLPVEGEHLSGDAVAVEDTPDGRTVLVVDGLGHGDAAAEASHTAVRVFRAAPDKPLPDLLTGLHRALRHTRGAAVGALRLRPGYAGFCGVGNVGGALVAQGLAGQRLMSLPGIVGLNGTAPRLQVFALPPGAAAVLHSDGVGTGWAAGRDADPVLRLPAPLLAAKIMRDHRRIRDDATVAVARPAGGAL
jgi:hypothetical protein